MLTPILIPDKNTHERRNNVNPTSKKFNFSLFWTFYVPTKALDPDPTSLRSSLIWVCTVCLGYLAGN